MLLSALVPASEWWRSGNVTTAPLLSRKSFFDLIPKPQVYRALVGPFRTPLDPWWVTFFDSHGFCVADLLDPDRFSRSQISGFLASWNSSTFGMHQYDHLDAAWTLYDSWSNCRSPEIRPSNRGLYTLVRTTWERHAGIYVDPIPSELIADLGGGSLQDIDVTRAVDLAIQVLVNNFGLLEWVCCLASRDLADFQRRIWLGDSDGILTKIHWRHTGGSNANGWINDNPFNPPGTMFWANQACEINVWYSKQSEKPTWLSTNFRNNPVLRDPTDPLFPGAIVDLAAILFHESVHCSTRVVQYRDVNNHLGVFKPYVKPGCSKNSKGVYIGGSDSNNCCALSYMMMNVFRWAMTIRFPELVKVGSASPFYWSPCAMFADDDRGLGRGPGDCDRITTIPTVIPS